MKQKLLATLATAQQYTLEIAGAMPEEGYAFRPADSIWTFGELIHHIGYGIYWWEDNFIRGKKTAWEPPVPTVGKKATIDYVKKAFVDLQKTVEGSADGDELVHGLWATLDHVTHHRGQATVYLRCKGIAPAEYCW